MKPPRHLALIQVPVPGVSACAEQARQRLALAPCGVRAVVIAPDGLHIRLYASWQTSATPALKDGAPFRFQVAFAPVDRISASLDGFHPERGNLSAPAAIRHPRRRSDGSGSDHGDHARGGRRAPFAFVHRGHVVSHPIRIFSETEVLRTGENARITCNTYSVPYKGKTLKKHLSPK